MRYFLLTALVIIIVLRYCGTTHRQRLQTATWQTANINSGAGDTLSSFYANNSAFLYSLKDDKDHYLDLKYAAGKNCRTGRSLIAQNKTSSGPAELTLEYIAVQLPRSH
jgi:hypothetical protein